MYVCMYSWNGKSFADDDSTEGLFDFCCHSICLLWMFFTYILFLFLDLFEMWSLIRCRMCWIKFHIPCTCDVHMYVCIVFRIFHLVYSNEASKTKLITWNPDSPFCSSVFNTIFVTPYSIHSYIHIRYNFK